MQPQRASDERFVEILAETLTLPLEMREDYLGRMCASDPQMLASLRTRVLLNERMQGFLDEPVFRFVPPPPPVDVGDILAERFVLKRRLGSGGMGVVFEAYDLRLDEKRAIKCALAGEANSLPPEAKNAMKVAHQNVCRIFEMHTAETINGPMDFLVMELVEGESLARRLGKGRLDTGTAVEIGRQIIEGLEAAHARGIIHQDLKSDNIMLGPGGGALRAVITDFGLAGPAATVKTGALRGTRGYIAPEIWRGEAASEASDIYALGVILFEMVTGRRPYRADATVEDLQALPPKPSSLVPGLDSRWDRTILGCLDPDPAKRFRSATLVRTSLLDAPSPAWLWPSAVAAALALVTLVYIAVRPGPEIVLAVLPVETSGASVAGAAGLAPDLAERLSKVEHSEGLFGRSRFAVLPSRELDQAQAATPAEAARRLGATHVVAAALREDAGMIHLKASVADTRTGERLRELTGKYLASEAGLIPATLAGLASGAFHLASTPDTVTPQAYPHYMEGLAWNLKRDERAGEAFRKAAALDPKSALPLAGLAEFQALQFSSSQSPEHRAAALETLGRARARNPDSGQVLLASAYIHGLLGQFDRARDDAQRAVEVMPGNPNAWRRLGRALEGGGRNADAVAAYRRAIEVGPSFAVGLLDFGTLQYRLGNHQEAERLFTQAMEMAPDSTRALYNLGGLNAELGRFAQAERLLRRGLAVRQSRQGWTNLGAVLFNQSRFAEALESHQRALASGQPSFVLYSNLGDTHHELGNAEASREAYRAGRDLAEQELLERPANALTRAFYAYFAARLGEPAAARREIRQAVQLGPDEPAVQKRAIITYEILGLRETAIELAGRAGRQLLAEIERSPMMPEFRRDRRFVELVGADKKKEKP